MPLEASKRGIYQNRRCCNVEEPALEKTTRRPGNTVQKTVSPFNPSRSGANPRNGAAWKSYGRSPQRWKPREIRKKHTPFTNECNTQYSNVQNSTTHQCKQRAGCTKYFTSPPSVPDKSLNKGALGGSVSSTGVVRRGTLVTNESIIWGNIPSPGHHNNSEYRQSSFSAPNVSPNSAGKIRSMLKEKASSQDRYSQQLGRTRGQ